MHHQMEDELDGKEEEGKKAEGGAGDGGAGAVRPVEGRAREVVEGEFKGRKADDRRGGEVGGGEGGGGARGRDGRPDLHKTFSIEPATPV